MFWFLLIKIGTKYFTQKNFNTSQLDFSKVLNNLQHTESQSTCSHSMVFMMHKKSIIIIFYEMS